jgi:hypothetical protein
MNCYDNGAGGGVCGAPTCGGTGSPCLASTQCCVGHTCSNGARRLGAGPGPNGGITPDGAATGGTCN